MRHNRQMSTIQNEYEVVDLYARACADALEIEINNLSGTVDEQTEPDNPDTN